MKPVVLVLTHPDDVHAHAVIPHLDAMGVQVHRLDTATLGTPAAPVTARLRAGRVTGDLAGCDLARIIGVWHRRPSQFATDDPAVAAELRAGIGGILATLPYLNHPADMAAAAFKPRQLVLAGQVGLSVPESLVTTVPGEAAGLALRLGDEVVVKAMSSAIGHLVSAEDCAGWQRPIHLTQQRIGTTRHVRLTVVDRRLFAAMITSPHLDWRRDDTACRYGVVETPPEIASAVWLLMSRLRLRYGALDFAVDHSDRWWFLEVNPNGQFLWIEHETNLPISAAVADALRHTTPPLREDSGERPCLRSAPPD